MKKNKLIFLDRDGTINIDKGYVHLIKDWQLTPGAIVGLQTLTKHGFRLAVVTNQSGIGHGLYKTKDMQALHDHMIKELQKKNVNIAAVAYCPHKRGSICECRKPKTGMIEKIIDQVGPTAMNQSWTIGDKLNDIELGHNAGTNTALIKSRYWQTNDLVLSPTIIADSLLDASRQIIKYAK